MSSGFPERDLYGNIGFGGGSAINNHPIHVPFQRSDGGGLLKRSLTELERQQLQHALFLRSVKQKTHHTSPISHLPPVDFSSFVSHEIPTVASSLPSFSSSTSSGYSFQRAQQSPTTFDFSFSPVPAATESDSVKKSSSMRNRLQELERRLLLDDDDEDEVSVSGSVVTTSELNETMQQLISPTQSPLSPSPTTSSSSSSSSSASCSPSSTTPSKQLLLDTASAISDGNLDAAASNLARLKRVANPRGDADQRLTAYMVSALLSRMNPPPSDGHSPVIAELYSGEHLAATQLLYEASPCFKLGFMAANLAILEATRDHSKIHILDFDIGHGGQYITLIHALAEQHRNRTSGSPPAVKITAVTDPTSPINSFNNNNSNSNSGNLWMVGDRITNQAERVGVRVRFNVVCRRTAELSHSTLGCEPDEALAVSFPFVLSKMADESVSPANPRDELLRRVKGLGPRVVTLVEQEANSNTAPFAARFTDACGHYGALLDSLEGTMSRESAPRAKIEECLGRKAANSVAREGAERIERCEVFGKWRARMGMAGFKPSPVGPGVTESVKTRLGSYGNNPGFTLKEEAGGLCFGWMGRVLTVASVWH